MMSPTTFAPGESPVKNRSAEAINHAIDGTPSARTPARPREARPVQLDPGTRDERGGKRSLRPGEGQELRDEGDTRWFTFPYDLQRPVHEDRAVTEAIAPYSQVASGAEADRWGVYSRCCRERRDRVHIGGAAGGSTPTCGWTSSVQGTYATYCNAKVEDLIQKAARRGETEERVKLYTSPGAPGRGRGVRRPYQPRRSSASARRSTGSPRSARDIL